MWQQTQNPLENHLIEKQNKIELKRNAKLSVDGKYSKPSKRFLASQCVKNCRESAETCMT